MGIFVVGDRNLPPGASLGLDCSQAVCENHSGAGALFGWLWSAVFAVPSGLGPDAPLYTPQGSESDLLLLSQC